MPHLSLDPFCLVEPARSQKDKCQLCSESFGITTREHLCKRCFRFVCDKCSPHKLRIYKADMQHRQHRMCKQCYTQSQILRKYVQSNKLAWGQDSDMSRLWLKQLGRQGNNRASINTSKGGKQNGKGRLSFEVSINELWSSLNYSFRQLIGISIDRNKELQGEIEESNKKQKFKNISLQLHKIILQQLLQLLANVVNSINNPNIQPQNIIYILMFFLAHASPPNALIFTKSVIQFLSFQEASVETITYYLQKLQCSDVEIYKMENYIQSTVSKIANTATINYFSAQASIQIVSAIISKKNFYELERGIAYTICKRKQYIIKNANKPDLVLIDLLRNNQGLGDGYKKFVKLCQAEQNQEQIGGTRNPSKRNSDSTKSIIRDQQFYNNLIKQNQQLKIKNKNQQEQIIRLKVENNRMLVEQKRRKSRISDQRLENFRKNSAMEQINNDNTMDMIEIDDFDLENSEQSYWEQVLSQGKHGTKDQHSEKSAKIHSKLKKMIEQQLPQEFKEEKNYDNVINQFKNMNHLIDGSDSVKKSFQQICKWQYKNGKNRKFVKKYRKKQSYKNLKRMTTMSQKLVKDINSLKDDGQQNKQCKHKQSAENKNEQMSKLMKQIKQIKSNTNCSLVHENKQLKQELARVQQLNKGLLQKMSQLSIMLMDKEQEQVNESKQSLQELMQLYEAQQLKGGGESCSIF